MVQVTMETTGRMLVGSEIGAALTVLDALRPDVIGLNCATEPAEMTEHLRHLSRHARMFLSCLPNAGLPSVIDGATHYDLTPDAPAVAHDRFTEEFGVNIVGGCCGTTPEHLRRVVETIGMSGLLVKSTLIMRENLEDLNARDLWGFPVILGGAALTRNYVERDLRAVYPGPGLLRQGRLRGAADHGGPHGGQAARHARPRLRTDPRGSGPAAA